MTQLPMATAEEIGKLSRAAYELDTYNNRKKIKSSYGHRGGTGQWSIERGVPNWKKESPASKIKARSQMK